MMRQAVFYNYIILGEASRSIPPEIQALAPEIPWRIIGNLRNVMAHEYFQVNLEIVWQTTPENLPPLKQALQQLLAKYGDSPAS